MEARVGRAARLFHQVAHVVGRSLMIFEQVRVSGGDNFTYLVGDDGSKEAAVIDPAGAVAQIQNLLKSHGLHLKYIINTHGHSDHTRGNRDLASDTGARIAAHVKSSVPKDMALQDGDILTVGRTQLKVLYTPGHTSDSICIISDGHLLTGDTLFVGECGRTDLPGGDAGQMYDSLLKISRLSDDIKVYPGHDYGSKPNSTIGFEKSNNYVLKPRTRAEFIHFMSEP
ncbi:MAG: MBL fold metallo-hydrolase [archaeon]